MTAADTPADPTRLANLDFAVHRSRRYHNKLKAHYDGLNRLAMTLVLIGGSATFGRLTAPDGSDQGAINWLAVIASATVTALAAFDRTFGLAEKARLHQDLYRRFSALAAEIAVAGADMTTTQLNDFVAKRLHIEADEPGEKRIVNLICHNEEALARGQTNLYRIPAIAAATAFFLTWRIPEEADAVPSDPVPPASPTPGSCAATSDG
ncbi:hypothetical protein [Oharaeibacter diazotrophicus]|uniref:SMODS and SLOG-associating 2TM effector domain-containing protein n=1 Tax=Oharaeibacter diazotrophicus TaxID=1920512 RepID=A0A4R6RIC4_9HYPH|nr:hypothetical protein [Oharaeibacter diazotrophicus]TDP86203.1 hypothetical protein EDD54_0071 [Oharaeibacter diazotrophicus]BBE71856.1 hypothetical protein OHA_1_01441 [Pleomorphomonas sp. SM30]GLS78620.1 hypothetical protein GCM10007904_39570 [Oharaeibacter diazotrophicus]